MCDWETFNQLLSTFRVAGRYSVNFRKLSMWPESLLTIFVRLGDLLSTFRETGRPSVNFSFGWETFRQIASNFRVAGRPNVSFRQFLECQGDFPAIPSSFHATGSLSVNFRHLVVRPGDVLASSGNFPYGWKTFRLFLSRFCAGRKPLSTSVNFLCRRETFSQLS